MRQPRPFKELRQPVNDRCYRIDDSDHIMETATSMRTQKRWHRVNGKCASLETWDTLSLRVSMEYGILLQPRMDRGWTR